MINLCRHPTQGTNCDTWFSMSMRLILTTDDICSLDNCWQLVANVSSSDWTIAGFWQHELHGSANSTTIYSKHHQHKRNYCTTAESSKMGISVFRGQDHINNDEPDGTIWSLDKWHCMAENRKKCKLWFPVFLVISVQLWSGVNNNFIVLPF